MILLDTNVLSALMRVEPDPQVITWLDGQPAESLWTTSITVFEVRFGLEILPTGHRRLQLEEAFAKALAEDLDHRILVFDRPAAEAAGHIAAEGRRNGRTLEIRDVQIAGIAAARKATIATRNICHFQDLGVDLIDPWSA